MKSRQNIIELVTRPGVLKRKKKKEQKEKTKRAQRINLEMIHPGDEGPKRQEENLFKLSKLTSKTDLETVMEQTPELLAEDSDDEGKKHS